MSLAHAVRQLVVLQQGGLNFIQTPDWTDAVVLAANTAETYDVSSLVPCFMVLSATASFYAKFLTGVGATFAITSAGSGPYTIATAAVNAAGKKYIIGDVLTIAGAGGDTLGTLTVTSVSATGGITGIEVTTEGSYASDPAGAAVAGVGRTVAAIPSADIATGTSPSLNPSQIYVDTDVSGISMIAPSNAVVTVGVYKT